VDRLISGSTTDFNDSLKYWRIQFTIIPQLPPPPTRQEREILPNGELAPDEVKDASKEGGKEGNKEGKGRGGGKEVETPQQPNSAVDPSGLNRALSVLVGMDSSIPFTLFHALSLSFTLCHLSLSLPLPFTRPLFHSPSLSLSISLLRSLSISLSLSLHFALSFTLHFTLCFTLHFTLSFTLHFTLSFTLHFTLFHSPFHSLSRSISLSFTLHFTPFRSLFSLSLALLPSSSPNALRNFLYLYIYLFFYFFIFLFFFYEYPFTFHSASGYYITTYISKHVTKILYPESQCLSS
jgi:hypothetical protein